MLGSWLCAICAPAESRAIRVIGSVSPGTTSARKYPFDRGNLVSCPSPNSIAADATLLATWPYAKDTQLPASLIDPVVAKSIVEPGIGLGHRTPLRVLPLLLFTRTSAQLRPYRRVA